MRYQSDSCHTESSGAGLSVIRKNALHYHNN